ncbi:MAG: tRNA 2-thiouridine(34) synthase MnmA [Planctomycetota bacterium]
MPKRIRVLVAMSGGVDSSAAAAALRAQGHDVIGVFMRNGVSDAAGGSRSCCSASDARDAAAVADRLSIPFYSVDFSGEFGALMDRFAAEYRAGRTPSPCVLCNQDLKFGHLFRLAGDLGAEAVATGHYARIEGGSLLRARDEAKDQSYYLFGIGRELLPRVRFPIGDLTKTEVRRIAKSLGLSTADKKESMEICFVTTGSYRDVVRERGGAGIPGRFVDLKGRVLGRHDGIDAFTVGQRRGLPALGEPRYVVAIDPESGDVTLGSSADLLSSAAILSGLRWLRDPPGRGEQVRAQVKVRARGAPIEARVRVLGEGAIVLFEEPATAVTPGQAAVFYDGERVLGGGWIERSPGASAEGDLAPA